MWGFICLVDFIVFLFVCWLFVCFLVVPGVVVLVWFSTWFIPLLFCRAWKQSKGNVHSGLWRKAARPQFLTASNCTTSFTVLYCNFAKSHRFLCCNDLHLLNSFLMESGNSHSTLATLSLLSCHSYFMPKSRGIWAFVELLHKFNSLAFHLKK